MKNISLLFIVLLLSGCANIRPGNFTSASERQSAFLARDAASQLSRVYPGVQKSFCIGQRITDSFGIHLVHNLREKGYSLIELKCPKQKANFFYVLDRLEPGTLYRVSLFAGTETLSRMYAKNNEKIIPVSAWTHKE